MCVHICACVYMCVCARVCVCSYTGAVLTGAHSPGPHSAHSSWCSPGPFLVWGPTLVSVLPYLLSGALAWSALWPVAASGQRVPGAGHCASSSSPGRPSPSCPAQAPVPAPHLPPPRPLRARAAALGVPSSALGLACHTAHSLGISRAQLCPWVSAALLRDLLPGTVLTLCPSSSSGSGDPHTCGLTPPPPLSHFPKLTRTQPHRQEPVSASPGGQQTRGWGLPLLGMGAASRDLAELAWALRPAATCLCFPEHCPRSAPC